MDDPFAPSTDPDIPTPTRDDLLRQLRDGTERSLLAEGKLESGRSETLWRAARSQWDERHKRAAERRAEREAKPSHKEIGLPLAGGALEGISPDVEFPGTFRDIKPNDTTPGTRVPGQVADDKTRLPFPQLSERQIRHERMQRDIYIHGHPDPKDVAAEEAEELRYQLRLADARAQAQKQVEEEFSQSGKKDEPIPESKTGSDRNMQIPEKPPEKPFHGRGLAASPHWEIRETVSRLKLVGAIVLAFATLYGFIAGAFQVAGVFSVLLAHSLLVIGWFGFMASVFLIEHVLLLPRQKKIAVTLFVGIISAAFMFGMDRWMISLKAQQSQNSPPSASSGRKLLNKTPRQLLALYERGNTPLQADQLMEPFKGEWVRVTGKIDRISPSSLNVVVVTLKVQEGDKTDTVAASFDLKDGEGKKRFLQLDPGDTITVEGRIAQSQPGDFLYLTEAEYIGP